MITAVGIKKLYYAETSAVTGDLTGAMLKTILETAKEVKNVHQDTWNIDEADPSITNYKNQLSKQTYRQTKELGDVVMNFTIGQYDYDTKADLMGGEAIKRTGESVGWKRARGNVNINNCLIAKTEDDVWIVFPKGSVVAREANTDGAIGIAVSGTSLEPENTDIAPEYWFDDSEVNTEV